MDDFNSDSSTTKRTQVQLKKAWDNRKQIAKKASQAKKKSIRRTGGGPADKPLPPELERVCAMIPEQMDSLKNPYDCDEIVIELGNQQPIISSIPNEIPDKGHECNNLPSSPIHDEAQNNPTFDRTETERPVEMPKTSCAPKKKNDPRSLLVEYEKMEHEERMRNLNLQRGILTMEHSIKKRTLEMMEEEHCLKLQILGAKLSAHPPV
ncbi:unnamed protein product [Orchesella dallaii]|uniref:Uncharacterized protein n=1 Tax=Orchesella dallaii TaxID=48710 RepID=A0ABP1QT16_9HEXA